MKKVLIISILIIIFGFSSCDNIDNLSLIAGIGYFEMEIIKPGENDKLETGKDCLVKWILPEKRAKKISLHLIKDNKVVYTITPGTENDGEYLWEDINAEPAYEYQVRISILDGVYTGRKQDSSIFIISESALPDPLPDPDKVYFKDIYFEVSIRGLIGKDIGEIYKDDVKNITSLYLPERSIIDVTGLEHFIALETLNLSINTIIDISLISSLNFLINVNLSKNNIEDISALSNLYELNMLNLDNNSITDITSLNKLTGLINLSMANNEISDISALSGIPYLKYFNLSSNNIQDISPLSAFPSLEVLILADNNITDISPLLTIASLQVVDITDNPVEENHFVDIVSQLEERGVLVHYKFPDTSIEPTPYVTPDPAVTPAPEDVVTFSDINLEQVIRVKINKPDGDIYIDDVNNIVSLFLISKGITDITGLEYFYALETLNIAGNNISDVSPLSGLSSLKHLNLSNNNIADISPLSALSFLKVLNLDYNQLLSISNDVFLGLSSLRLLSLSNNKTLGRYMNQYMFQDFNPLQYLNLSSCKLTFILTISDMISLKILNLADNEIRNITPLNEVDSLYVVNLNNNLFNAAPYNIDIIKKIEDRGGLVNLNKFGGY